MMSAERRSRVEELFENALEVPHDEREAFIVKECGGDDELRDELESLLQHHHRASDDGFMPAPASDAASSEPLPPAGADPYLGKQIGNYRIKRLLGRGGMAVVYEAEQESPHRTVALKMIAPYLVSRSLLRRFEAEAEILARLEHPAIATIFEAGTYEAAEGTRPFFAMEFVRGEPLTDYAARRELTWRQRLELLVRVAEGVHHAHQKGVIHRDLKPGNILVTASGQPKILDFGVARVTDADIRTTTLQTDFGQIIGTIPYMSPEQAAGDPDELDTRSDVYALGILAYELLTGRLPYDIQNKMIHEAVRVIREDAPIPLSTINRTLRGDVEVILGMALEKEKSRRYESAAALAVDIRRYLMGEPILAIPPSAWYTLRKLARRHVAATVVAIAVAVIVLSTTFTSTFFYAKTNTALSEKREAYDALNYRNQVLEDIVTGTHGSVMPLTLQGFLAGYRSGAERQPADPKTDTSDLTPANRVIRFLQSDTDTVERLLEDLGPSFTALAHYAAGEKHLKQGDVGAAIAAFRLALRSADEPGWARSASNARLNELRIEPRNGPKQEGGS